MKVTDYGVPSVSPSGPIPLLLADTCAQFLLQLQGFARYHLNFQHMDFSLVADSATAAHWESKQIHMRSPLLTINLLTLCVNSSWWYGSDIHEYEPGHGSKLLSNNQLQLEQSSWPGVQPYRELWRFNRLPREYLWQLL